jgi:hypothetical protein
VPARDGGARGWCLPPGYGPETSGRYSDDMMAVRGSKVREQQGKLESAVRPTSASVFILLRLGFPRFVDRSSALGSRSTRSGVTEIQNFNRHVMAQMYGPIDKWNILTVGLFKCLLVSPGAMPSWVTQCHSPCILHTILLLSTERTLETIHLSNFLV